MEFRRNAARDDRRRRAILDDRNAAGRKAGDAEGDDGANGKRPRRYSSQALLERRVRVVDFIPLHWFSVCSYYLLGIVLIGLLAALHYYASERLPFANLASVNSLGGWLAIIAFWTAAQGALVIYRIRRHRLDDYRGRYHVWLWGVAFLAIAGVDLLVDFRTPIGQAIEQASGRQFAELEQGWAILVATLFYGIALLRIVWEVRASRGTLAVAVLSLLTLGTFVASQANLILWPPQLNAQLSTCVLYLGGVWLLSMMLMQYARFVWMDAIGLIAQQAVVEAAQEETTEETTAKKTSRRRPKIVKKDEEESASDETEEDSDSGWFSWGSKKSKPAAEEDAAEKAPASKRATKPTIKTSAKSEEEDAPAEPKRSWFGWGRKRQADDEGEASDQQATTKPAAKKAVAAKQDAETEESSAPKRGWFGFGGKKEAASDGAAAEPKKPAEQKKPVEKAPAAELPAADKKRGWFGFGGKKDAATEVAAEEKKPVKKQPAEEETADKKRGWFGFGGKAKSEPEPEPAAEKKSGGSPLAASARRAVVKQQQANTSAPPETIKMDPLTLGGNDSDNDIGNDEIAALEAKPDHMLTKAERRRLKKLKRRGAAA